MKWMIFFNIFIACSCMTLVAHAEDRVPVDAHDQPYSDIELQKAAPPRMIQPLEGTTVDAHITVPEGMEVRQLQNLNFIVPKGAKLIDLPAQVKAEELSGYVGRNFEENRKRFENIERRLEVLEKKVETLSAGTHPGSNSGGVLIGKD